MFACPRLHFRRLVFPWTDPSLGNCSYLDTCRHMRTCKYIHYEINDEADLVTPDMMARQNRPPVPSYLEVLPTVSMLGQEASCCSEAGRQGRLLLAGPRLLASTADAVCSASQGGGWGAMACGCSRQPCFMCSQHVLVQSNCSGMAWSSCGQSLPDCARLACSFEGASDNSRLAACAGAPRAAVAED